MSSAVLREKITSLSLLTVLCLIKSRSLLAFFAKMVYCYLVVTLSTMKPRAFSERLLSNLVAC